MSYNNRNQFDNRDNRSFRRTRRGNFKVKANHMKLTDALKKLKEMDKLQEKVNILEAERLEKIEAGKKVLEEEEKIKAKEIAEKLEDETNKNIALIVSKAVQEQCATLIASSLKAPDVKETVLGKVEAMKKVPSESAKKPWYAWFWK